MFAIGFYLNVRNKSYNKCNIPCGRRASFTLLCEVRVSEGTGGPYCSMFGQHSSGTDLPGTKMASTEHPGPMNQHQMANTRCLGNLKQAMTQSGL